MLMPTGNINNPIIVLPDSTPDACPNCNKEELKVEVCKHCGYIYPEDNPTGKEILICFLIGLIIIIILIWGLITGIHWFMNNERYGYSLVEIIISQFEYIKELRIFPQ